MLQMLLNNGDPRLVCPKRDVAHNTEFVLKEMAGRIQSRTCPLLNILVDKHNISEDEILVGLKALIHTFAFCLHHPEMDYYQTVVESGLLNISLEAQALLMAAYGQILFGIAWQGMREATAGGNRPPLDTAGLVRIAAELACSPACAPLPSKV